MLDANLKTQLKGYLERLEAPIELVASLGDGASSQELRGLLQDIVSLSERITLREDGSNARKPSFSVNRVGEDTGVHFAGIPLGHEFTSLVLALLQVGGYPPKVEPEVIEQIRGLPAGLVFETRLEGDARLLARLNPVYRVAAFRVAQEAITNVVRHARATRCTLRLRVSARDGPRTSCAAPRRRSMSTWGMPSSS